MANSGCIHTRVARGALLAAVFALVATGCLWRGPSPSTESLAASTGPLATASTVVPRQGTFGGGTIYYPTDEAQGTYAGVAVMPGFLMAQSTIAWYGPRLASWGFVVFTLDSLSTTDLPAARATQLQAALAYLTTTSAAKDRVDPGRLAVMGWSMGGGGALEAARANPAIRAAVPLAPWGNTTDYSSLATPTLFVTCQNDTIAPNASHSRPMYESIPDSTPKASMEIAGGDHFCVTKENATIASRVIPWLKVHLDGDTRFSPFVCPAPPVGGPISASVGNCPDD